MVEKKKKSLKNLFTGLIILIFAIVIYGIFSPNTSDKTKPVSTQHQIKAVLDRHFDGVQNITYTKSRGFLFATVKGNDSVNIKQGMWLSTRYTLKDIKSIRAIKEIYLNITFPMQDKSSGKKQRLTVMKVDFKRATINKIDFNTFQMNDVPSTADKYWQSPAFSE